MKLLLDTHTFLWWLDDVELNAESRAAIADPANQVFVSAASAWEISVKRALGKLSVEGDLVDQIAASQFEQLPITFNHGLAAGGLPMHHRDPFDRMLVAQARAERMTLVTRDSRMRLYEVAVLAA